MKKVLVAFERYIQAVRSPVTAAKYGSAVKGFVSWLRGQGVTHLDKAPLNSVRNYCIFMVEEGYSPATVYVRIAGVNRFLKWCRDEGLKIPDFYPAELPRRTTKVKDVIPSELFGHYFRLAEELNEPARTAVLLLPCSGLRAQELCSLPLVCFRRVPLKLRDGTKKQTLSIIVKGKGGNERFVPLLDEGAQAVAAYLKGWRRRHPDTRWLFPGREEGHIADRTLRKAVQKVRVPLKMTWTPHTMRRTYLTTLYRKGVDPIILQKIAGHKNLKTLINHYLYLDEQDLAGAVHGSGGRLTD
jgi:site-specific recombinase XerD